MPRIRVLVTIIAVVAALAGTSTMAEAACPSPGSGSQDPLREPTREPGTVSFTGGGFGHGLGMSQYGAHGAALLGCGHAQILAGFYPTTARTSRDDLVSPRVGLLLGASTTVSASTLTNTGSSGIPFVHAGTTVGRLRPGRDLRVTMTATGRARLAFEDDATWTQPGSGATTVTASLGASGRRLTIAGKSGIYNRGTLRLEIARVSAGRFEHVIDVDMEAYLLGLAEMPYSWPSAALRAQAIAGRTFAEAVARSQSGCTCTLFDSQRHQVYEGGRLELAANSSWDRWRTAVEATAGDIVVRDDRPITAFYSSSHGGASQDLSEAWGAPDVPYVVAQDTSRWEREVAPGNSRHRWVEDRPARSVASDHGLAVLSGVRVSARTSQGRARTVAVTGWDDRGRVRTRAITDEDAIRQAFGLPSNNLDVRFTHGRRGRIAGSTRYGTAAAASRAGWPGGADTVVVARGDDPADALGGVALAGRHRAPLLLSATSDLPRATREEVTRLGATRAFVLGGTTALEPAVVDALQAAGVDDVVRVAGHNRFETMALVAARTADRGSGTAFVVRAAGPGDTWADAMAISGVAARRATEGAVAPVLGVGPRGIPAETRAAIRDLGIDEVVVVGGGRVVSAEQVEALRGLGTSVRRWAGATRYLTSASVARREPGGGRDVLVVTGRNFPDGLAAGALAGRTDATLLVAPPTFDTSRQPWRPGDFPDLLAGLAPRRDRVLALGGSSVVPARTVQAVSWFLTPGAGAPGGTSPAAATATTRTAVDEPIGAVGSRLDASRE